MRLSEIQVGTTVLAVHPRERGMVREGRVTNVGTRYAIVDFGGETFRVWPWSVLEVVG